MQTNNNALVAANQPQQATLDIFGSIQGFESGQRIAKMFASSNLVPDTFKGDVGGCLIALEMAQRMNANVLQVMQSLYIVHGRPTLSSAFLIASFNQTGRFTAIKYEFEGEEGKALLRKWGLKDTLVGVGNCILGYPDEDPAPKARVEGRIVKVD